MSPNWLQTCPRKETDARNRSTSSSSEPEPVGGPSPTPWPRRANGCCLLERGHFLPRETENWSPDDVFVDGRYISKDTWYDGEGTAFQPQVHYFVGGATKLYGAALYRLRPEDFGEIRHVDGISPAWPVGYDEFEPFYTKAEQLYQVHGIHGEDPTEGPSPSRTPRRRSAMSRACRRSPTPSPPRGTTRFRHPAASCSTKPTATAASASVARGATVTPAWSTPRPTPRSWRSGPASSRPT